MIPFIISIAVRAKNEEDMDGTDRSCRERLQKGLPCHRDHLSSDHPLRDGRERLRIFRLSLLLLLLLLLLWLSSGDFIPGADPEMADHEGDTVQRLKYDTKTRKERKQKKKKKHQKMKTRQA